MLSESRAMFLPAPTRWCAGFLVFLIGCATPDENGLIRAAGHVEATDVRVSSKVAGKLQSFPVEEGDQVSKADVVAQIDTVDLELAVAAARAQRDLATAGLRLPDTITGLAGRVPVDDVLDAAAASWSAERWAADRAQALPERVDAPADQTIWY